MLPVKSSGMLGTDIHSQLRPLAYHLFVEEKYYMILQMKIICD